MTTLSSPLPAKSADTPPPARSLALAATGVALVAALAWTWINLCRFPASPWNDVRLAPVFMAAQGVPVYTLPGEGVLTTWMYGPVPLWAWWPSTWFATDAVSALMGAGIVNTGLTVAVLVLTCAYWPNPTTTPLTRCLALGACLAAWPDHAFRFLQADNVAVALGLLANLCLVRSVHSPVAGRLLWLAATATAAAIGCKQTTLGLAAGQAIWLWHAQGRPAARAHLVRLAVAGAAFVVAAALQFGPSQLWFSLVTIPGALPAVEDVAGRLQTLLPHLALQLVLPLAVLAGARRHFLTPGAALYLPVFCFLASIPLGLAGMLSTGGTINSFQGFQYLVPAFAVAALSLPTMSGRGATTLAALAIAAVIPIRVLSAEEAPFKPATRQVEVAVALQAAHPHELWLPWNPLVTYFGDGRFYHAEDGIYVRFITGHPVSLSHASAGVPARMNRMAFPSPAMQWGVAAKLAPASRREESREGWWVISWP